MSEGIILVVEDDAVVRKLIVRALEEEHYAVVQASTGHEIIRILESQPVSLVLTDRKMPWMDGDWVLSYVRTNYPKIPVVFITGYPHKNSEFKPDALLVKPFAKERLLEVVHGLVRKSH